MNSIIRYLIQYILDNMYDDITMEKLEQEFYYNKFYLIRTFKNYTGYTIKEFINTVKVLKSVNPLLFTDDTILKIALNNGFNSQEYYSETFQNVLGTSPIKFRKNYKDIEETEDLDTLKTKKEYLSGLIEYRDQLLNMPNMISEKGYTRELNI